MNQVLSKLRPNRTFLVVAGLFFCYLSLSFLLRGGGQFYEDGITIHYAESIIQDQDFNLINQLPENKSWLVTKNYYHPDFHTEIQTPLITALYALEKVITGILGLGGHQVEPFVLSTFAMNFLLIAVTFMLLREYCDRLGITFSKSAYLLLTLGSSYFYFGFFVSTVIDIFALPLIIYSLIIHEELKRDELRSRWTLFSWGAALGTISIMKGTYIILTWFLIIDAVWRLLSRKLRIEVSWFFSAFLIVIFANFFNRFIKFGAIIDPHVTMRLFFDFSPLSALMKIWTGYFGMGGMFFINPIFLVSMVGLFFFFKERLSLRRMDRREVFFYGVWVLFVFFHTFFLIGIYSEDHLPGRAALNTLPFLFLGLNYLCTTKPKIFCSKLMWALIISWNLITVFSFVLIDLYDTYAYSSTIFPSGKLLQQTLMTYAERLSVNFMIYRLEFFSFLLFATFFSFIMWKSFQGGVETYIRRFVLLNLAAFFLFTVSNVSLSRKNVEQLVHQGFFQNKVIGDGPEIFFYDYFFDVYNNIMRSSGEGVREKLLTSKDRYYSIIQGQLISSTPEFDRMIEEQVDDRSFWLDSANSPDKK